MANLSEGALEEKKDGFKGEQLKPVDTLYAANSEKVDLGVAQRINLISAGVREKIEAKLGGKHEFLFQQALQSKLRRADQMDENARREAFKHAFEAVYGRFLFEDDRPLDDADAAHLDKVLADALKYPIDAKYGFKGRSELQAAIRRLALVSKSSFIAADKNEERDLMAAKRLEAQERLKVGQQTKQFLESARVDLSSNDVDKLLVGLDEIVEREDKSGDMLYALRGRRNSNSAKEISDARIEVESYFDQVENLEEQLRDRKSVV